MTVSENQDDLLSLIAGSFNGANPIRPWNAVDAKQPAVKYADDANVSQAGGTAANAVDAGAAAQAAADEEKLRALLDRVHSVAKGSAEAEFAPPPEQPANAAKSIDPAPAHAAVNAANIATESPPPHEFLPLEANSFHEAGLSESAVESLILKYLLSRGDASGRDVSDQIKLPFVLIDELLRQMKYDQLVVFRGAAPMNDYIYQLTDVGRERARRYAEHCTYYGSAPVSLKDYIESVKAQSLENQHPTEADLQRAFEDLLINKQMLERLGPAVNSGRGLFLFGFPGNGKTSIAERVTRSFGQTIWIPRAIGVDGEIIRLYDPTNHEEMPLERGAGLLDSSRIDRRWVRIRRPTIVVGGELTMDNLEVTLNTSTRISEAPMQLKSNCGVLVIDDFGRQRMRTDELLNRWIVPLEKRYDYLNLPNGKKIQVPFDQLIIFSTNLEPSDLVDDAFLRRIPYKIEVINPTEEEFRNLFKLLCPKMGFEYAESAIDHLLDRHYRPTNRPLRCCQPRDLLLQVRNYCNYRNLPLELTPAYLDFAVGNYFAVMK